MRRGGDNVASSRQQDPRVGTRSVRPLHTHTHTYPGWSLARGWPVMAGWMLGWVLGWWWARVSGPHQRQGGRHVGRDRFPLASRRRPARSQHLRWVGVAVSSVGPCV